MSAEIISFDPLVALRAKWDALDAQCTQLDERGEDRRRMSSACQWSRSRTALPRWCQCRPVAQRYRSGSSGSREISTGASLTNGLLTSCSLGLGALGRRGHDGAGNQAPAPQAEKACRRPHGAEPIRHSCDQADVAVH